VNDESSSTIAEDGMVIRADSDIRRDGADVSRAVRTDDQGKIWNVPGGMAAVGMAGCVEMRASGFEVGRLAFSELVNVNGMLARRKILDVQTDLNTCGRRRERSGADGVAPSVDEIDCEGLAGAAMRMVILSKSAPGRATGAGQQKPRPSLRSPFEQGDCKHSDDFAGTGASAMSQICNRTQRIKVACGLSIQCGHFREFRRV
jgi:hypothetical protein